VVLVRKALSISSKVGSHFRGAGSKQGPDKDIPIHQLPVVMTDKELNPYYLGSATSSSSAEVLDLSSTTEEEGYETPVRAFSDDDDEQDDERVDARAHKKGGKGGSVRYTLAKGGGRGASPRSGRTRSKSPLRMMVAATAQSKAAGGEAPAPAAKTRAPAASAPAAASAAPDRSTTTLPFDQPERFMDLSHAVRRMLVAAGGCGGEGAGNDEDGAVGNAAAPQARNTPGASASGSGGGGGAYQLPSPSNWFGHAALCGHGTQYYHHPHSPVAMMPGATASSASAAPPPPPGGVFAMSSCHPLIWAPPSAAGVPHPLAGGGGCHPALAWHPLYPWNTCAGGLAAAADDRDRHCMTGVLSVDEMEADSLVDMEDREQRASSKGGGGGVLATARDAAAVRTMSEEYDAVQDPEEELAAAATSASRSSSPAPPASACVTTGEEKEQVEVRERSSTPRPNPPKDDKDHPDDELVSKPQNSQQPKSKPPSPAVRFDDKAKQVRFLEEEEEEEATETDTYDASLLEDAPTTEPSDEEDDEDDLYDDDDEDGSMGSAEYIEFLRHRKERRFADCADAAAEQAGCSEHYAEYQVRTRQRTALGRGASAAPLSPVSRALFFAHTQRSAWAAP
jgi:hypothetical protein